MSCCLNNSSSCSSLLVDNDVQAPLVPSVLAAAIDLPLSPPGTDEFDVKPQSGGGRTLGSSSAGPSTHSQRGKSNNLGVNTAEAQKKLGKFFKGIGPSKVPSLVMVLRLILFISTRDIRFGLSSVYPTPVSYIRTTIHHSYVPWYGWAIVGLCFAMDVHLTTWQLSLQDHSFFHWCFHLYALRMPKENPFSQLMSPEKWNATYLELFNNKLCVLGLEWTITENCHVLTLDSFPSSYMLLISVSSTPISFC